MGKWLNIDKLLWRTIFKNLWQSGKESGDMLEVKFYDTVDDALLKFAVIISQSNGKWVFCKHKE